MHSGSYNGRMHYSRVDTSHMTQVHSFHLYNAVTKSSVSTSGDFCDNSGKFSGSLRGHGSLNVLGRYEKAEPTQVGRKKLLSRPVHADVTGGDIKSDNSERRDFDTSEIERHIEDCTVAESTTSRRSFRDKDLKHGGDVNEELLADCTSAKLLGRGAWKDNGLKARHTEPVTRSSSGANGEYPGGNKSITMDESRGIVQSTTGALESSRSINEKSSGENPRCLRTANDYKECEKAATEGVLGRGIANADLKAGSRSGEVIKKLSNTVDSLGIQSSTSKIDNQSWPTSPANVRVVRTRNLSEGSFNMIFAGAKKEGLVNELRSHAGSPRQDKSRDWSREMSESKDTGSFRDRSNLNHAQRSHKMVKQSGVDTSHPVARFTDLRILVSPNEVCSRKDNASASCDKECQTMSTTLSSSSKTPTNLSYARTPVGKTYSEGSTILPKVGNARSSTAGIITGGSFRRTETVSTGNSTLIAPNVVSKGIATSFGSITNRGKLMTPSQASYGQLTKDFNTQNHHSDSITNISSPQTHLPYEHLFLRKGLCSIDPNEVKTLGNDFYKKGGYHEALSLYDRAIALLPGQAPFHCNRTAALAALGLLSVKRMLRVVRFSQRLAIPEAPVPCNRGKRRKPK